MYVPIVPSVPHSTIINKTIIYSDAIIPLKDVGSNIKVTSISNIEEFSLERCLKIIFESNPGVVFNTVQYSKKDKKVYFYADSEISKKVWEDNNIQSFMPLTSGSEILEELKRVLDSEKNKEDDCISLYDVASLVKKVEGKYKKTKKSNEKNLNYKIKSKFGSKAILIIYDFDYSQKELQIGFSFYGNNFDKIAFSKINDDLYISKSDSCWSREIFATLCSELSILYDELLEFLPFHTEKNYEIQAINSNFLVDVCHYDVSIFVRSLTNRHMRNFELSSYSYREDYGCNCNSSIVINAFKGKEKELFKRIFIKISDCPNWSQSALYDIRKKQLEEEQIAEDEQRYFESKRQRKLELKRKIFSFLRKKPESDD